MNESADEGSEAERAAKGEGHRQVRHYFVDEAGDPNLFNRRKQIVVGVEGASRYFSLGALDVVDPDGLSADLTRLRAAILADPYFAGVPSLDPASRKTALAFHAKDDLPEIRKLVFDLLLRHPVKFYAVVRDKHAVVGWVRRRNARETGYRFSPNDLYDQLVRRLFKDRLHKATDVRICFAMRGSSDRTAALRVAIQSARTRFTQTWGITSEAPIQVHASEPRSTACLQAVDYFLWALQRRFERSESRFLDAIWHKVGLIVSADSGAADYGSYYTREKPVPRPDQLEKGQRI
jgi:hypothetical protein